MDPSLAQKSITCISCKFVTLDGYTYCPRCGKPLHSPNMSIWKQILMYVVSFCLPPFGLGWAFGYLRYPQKKAKTIGLIIIILTVISTALTIWYAWQMIGNLNKVINQQLNPGSQALPGQTNLGL